MSLINILNKNNLSQYQLAKKSGLPKSTISDICNNENGIDNCKVSTIIKIAHALNYSIDELIFEINNNDKKEKNIINKNINNYKFTNLKNKSIELNDYDLNFISKLVILHWGHTEEEKQYVQRLYNKIDSIL